MKEYKVELCWVKQAEQRMNELAAEGWRVLAVTPNIGAGAGLVITLERGQ